MQTVTIISRKAKHLDKEPFIITLEQWEKMDVLIKARFTMVATTSPVADDAAKQKRIDEIRKVVPPAETDFGALLKSHKETVTKDPEAAKVILMKMKVVAPNNSYVKKQLEKLK
jgi:hypothetical protein